MSIINTYIEKSLMINFYDLYLVKVLVKNEVWFSMLSLLSFHESNPPENI